MRRCCRLYGFDDEVALVTGGAAGLGFAIATRLAQEGAAVVRVPDQDADLGTKRALESSETSSNGPELIGIRSDAFDKLTNAHGMEIKHLMLNSADGALAFQLIEYVKGKQGELGLDHARCGGMHLSFLVDDVEAKHAELGARSFYTVDPDDVPVEFMELTR